MAKKEKKKIRENFRNACFERDGFRCKICGLDGSEEPTVLLDAHHITSRDEMPNGGYVKENGITLCSLPGDRDQSCHEKVEEVLQNVQVHREYAPAVLYKLIGSSYEQAIASSERL